MLYIHKEFCSISTSMFGNSSLFTCLSLRPHVIAIVFSNLYNGDLVCTNTSYLKHIVSFLNVDTGKMDTKRKPTYMYVTVCYV